VASFKYDMVIFTYFSYGHLGGIDTLRRESSLRQQQRLQLQGIPCYHCRRIIEIGSYSLRRRAGSITKAYHLTCAIKVNLIHWSLLLIIIQHGIISGLGIESQRIKMLEEIAQHAAAALTKRIDKDSG
jgi:hypothetical protein